MISQQPFAFQGKPPREQKPLPTELSKNITGICQVCGYKVQKIKYIKKRLRQPDGTYAYSKVPSPCPRCARNGMSGVFISLPPELRPWKLNRNASNRSFHCSVCTKRYYSVIVFGTLCSHKKHNLPVAYTCRFCCSKVGKQPITNSEVELPENENQQLNSSSSIGYADLETMMNRLVNAASPEWWTPVNSPVPTRDLPTQVQAQPIPNWVWEPEDFGNTEDLEFDEDSPF